MPFQVRGQLVLIKSSKLVHAAEAVTAAAGGAFVTMRSPADASVAQAAPASARIITAGTANFFMSPPTQSGDEIPGGSGFRPQPFQRISASIPPPQASRS